MRVRLLILLFLTVSIAYSQEPVTLQKLTGSITLDGRPDEDSWKQIDPVLLTMLMPELGDPPSQRTEIRITYDEQYLYVGANMWVESPDQITQKTKSQAEKTKNTLKTHYKISSIWNCSR